MQQTITVRESGYVMVNQDYDLVAIPPYELDEVIRRLQHIREGLI